MTRDFQFDALTSSVAFVVSRGFVPQLESGEFVLRPPEALIQYVRTQKSLITSGACTDAQPALPAALSALTPGILNQATIAALMVKQLGVIKAVPRIEVLTEAALHLFLVDIALLGYRPDLYCACRIDCLFDSQKSFFSLVEQCLGCSLGGLMEELFSQFGVSAASQELVTEALELRSQNRKVVSRKRGLSPVYLMYGQWIAKALVEHRGQEVVLDLVSELADDLGIQVSQLASSLSDALQAFFARPDASRIRIPPYLANIVSREGPPRSKESERALGSPRTDSFPRLVSEIKACLRVSVAQPGPPRFPQLMMCVFESLIHGIGFRRVIFLRLEPIRQILIPYFLFGEPHPNYSRILQPLKSKEIEHQPDVQAVLQRRCLFQGDPIFDQDWPFVSFPLVWQNQVQGVFYADMGSKVPQVPLTESERLACLAISELVMDIPQNFI